MTFDPSRRWGPCGVAGAHVRPKSADLHEGDRRDFLRRHETEAAAAVRGNSTLKKSFLSKLFTRTADSRNLRLAWDYLASGGGQAPGPDGLRYSDLEDNEVWNLVRTLRNALLNDTYRPNKDRSLRISKTSGKGFRTLAIPSIIDRVVQRAIVQTTQPYLDLLFEVTSLGYRPGSDINKALALAEGLAVKNGLWVWLTEDLKDAFNHVPQQRLLDVIRIHLHEERMMRLVGRAIQTETGTGIRQGGNLSPLLLNLYLDHFLDKKWRTLRTDVPLLRWADDTLVLCRSQEEALHAYQGLQQLLLPTGMKLKSTAELAIYDLENGAEWLGYHLSKGEGGLKVFLTEKAWVSLAGKLELCHEDDSSPLKAVETITGWLSQMGPCFNQTDIHTAYARIGSLAHNLAFDEIPSLGEVRRCWQQAHQRWEAGRKVGKGVQGKLPVAPPTGYTSRPDL